MSLLLKSELRLRIGARHCLAEVWSAGLVARCGARVMVGDAPQNPVEAALTALSAQGVELPRRAAVLVEDELLYHATLPASGGMKQGLEAAREHFGSAMPEQEMVVGVTLMDGGQRWLASALPSDLLETWRLVLDAHDVQLALAQPAIQQDLLALRASQRLRDGLVVAFGSEGLGLVTLQNDAVSDLRWERRDLADLPGLAARLRALLSEQLPNASADLAPASLVLLPQSPAQAASLRPWAESNGWRLAAPAMATVE